MDRRVIRRLVATASFLLATALLLTCSNPIDLLATLETEVKIANNKFLVVNSVTPALNLDDVNPGISLTIVFDRELDQSTISDGIISLSPLGSIIGYDITYTVATKTLAIHALPYLANEIPYTATLNKNLRGADGSELQNEYVWGFTTGTYAAGSITIVDADGHEATNSLDVGLEFSYNDAVVDYRYSVVSAGGPWQPWVGKDASLAPFEALDLPDADTLDGLETVWVQYRGGAPGYTESLVQTGTIILDRAAPVVPAMSTRYINIANQATGIVPTVTASDATSGIKTYAWSGAGLSFSDPAVRTPTINAGSDSTYSATLMVTDYAGLAASNTLTVIRDTVAPNTPTFTASTTVSPTLDNTPTWAWASGGGGNGVFVIELDSLGADKTDATSFTPKEALKDGSHTFTVMERDAAGNYSAQASRTIVVTPVIPVNKAEGIPTTQIMSWRPSETKSYAVYLGSKELVRTIVDINSFAPALEAWTKYYWYYVDDSKIRHPTSDYYYFITGK